MFLFSQWEQFCREVSQSYNCIRADEIFQVKGEKDWLVIKHDVEVAPLKALHMARIEAKYGIAATYYVQSYLLDESADIFKEIQNLGHELTYHYDVLDANNGDYDKALEEFQQTVDRFEEREFPVKTVCPHGNPVMKRCGWSSNKDFFRNSTIKEKYQNIFDIVVDLPKVFDEEVVYISDAGFGWKQIVNVDSNDVKNQGDIDLKTISGVGKVLTSNTKVIVSSHPHRWENSLLKAYFNLFRFKLLRNAARFLVKIPFIKSILSRFYYLAKKI
jgi:hypothetical protein